jgi:hypothetical protein
MRTKSAEEVQREFERWIQSIIDAPEPTLEEWYASLSEPVRRDSRGPDHTADWLEDERAKMLAKLSNEHPYLAEPER